MKRFGSFWGAALLLVLGMCALTLPGLAHAQTTSGDEDENPELARDWSVRLGLFIFQSDAARSKSGDIGFSGDVERRVYAGNNYDLTVGIGYKGLNDVYSVPIMINLIASQYNLRYGFGVGYAFGKRVDGRGTSGTVLGLQVGYQLIPGRNPLSLDLRYLFIGGSSSELDGYSLTLGMRF